MRDRVLERFEIDAPAPTLDGLRAVYGAWCRHVSFDNVQKRISIVEHHDHLAGGEPEEFFENLLVHGTGGTCWPTSAALAALLEAVGFRIRRLVAAMNYERIGIRPGHGSTVAEIDGRDCSSTARCSPSSPSSYAAATGPSAPIRYMRSPPSRTRGAGSSAGCGTTARRCRA